MYSNLIEQPKFLTYHKQTHFHCTHKNSDHSYCSTSQHLKHHFNFSKNTLHHSKYFITKKTLWLISNETPKNSQHSFLNLFSTNVLQSQIPVHLYQVYIFPTCFTSSLNHVFFVFSHSFFINCHHQNKASSSLHA